MNMTVRKALPSDGQVILSLVDALAAYEKLTPPDQEARKRLLIDLFSGRPRIELYLEDLFVLPECRGMKAGYALFTAMVSEARSRGCGRMEWTVLDWNEPAINFYRRSGARHMKEWQLYRLVREDMVRILEKE